ncbi:2-hydroxyglutaryl-CoA dehydratase [Betaproteobacteria bacterium]|nr:2-hydroxyglutaryl-CoA dehydratase [Betaproteobacteria bacterium]
MASDLMKVGIGLDLGSTAIKMVITDGEKILCGLSTATAPGQEEIGRQLIARGLESLDLTPEQVSSITTTGYGKKLYSAADLNMDEISANAAGIFRLSRGQARTVINIGGQDLKVISLNDDGKVLDFRMNDKCAAGTGRFFELVSRLLDTPLSEFGNLAGNSGHEVQLSSTCVVFAESEIISLLARGVTREDIIRALHTSVARKVAAMMGRTPHDDAIYLDGGPARNRGLVEAIEDELLCDIMVLDDPQFTVAFGAAIQGSDVRNQVSKPKPPRF